MKENSIKNERSSIEEDIKIINNFITYFNKNIQNGNKADLTILGEEINALEHILSEYKRILKENEELKDFKKQVTDIESTNFIKYKNYISIQKVKDKIEELNQYYKKEIYPILYQWGDITITEHYDEMIGLLQEIIGDK